MDVVVCLAWMSFVMCLLLLLVLLVVILFNVYDKAWLYSLFTNIFQYWLSKISFIYVILIAIMWSGSFYVLLLFYKFCTHVTYWRCTYVKTGRFQQELYSWPLNWHIIIVIDDYILWTRLYYSLNVISLENNINIFFSNNIF